MTGISTHMLRSFASDNNSGAHPEVLSALIAANNDHAVGYGDDPWTTEATRLVKLTFGGDPKVAFTFNGTGANILALASGSTRYEAVLCSKDAHIHTDECGAPEAFLGSKIIPIETQDSKITPSHIERYVHWRGVRHHPQPKIISITQSTELGQCYSLQELRALVTIAKQNNLRVHIDGARLSNAAASLNLSLKQLTSDLGIDIVSFGGTKNGLAFGECVIAFNPDLFPHLEFYQKRSAQLASKMRFISSQFIPYLSKDLYLQNARHANRMAKELELGLRNLGMNITREVQANAVFCTMLPEVAHKLLESYFFYIWNPDTQEVRLMTSFDSTEDDISNFIATLESISQEIT